MGIGSNHQLPVVGRVGKNLLVAGHPGVKTYLPKGGPILVANGFPIEYGAIGK